jgi:hypothetical protein
VKRISTIGLALVAAFAISIVAASGANAFSAEFGKCVKLTKAEGAGYSDSGCTKEVTSKAKYVWQPLAAGSDITYKGTGKTATLESVPSKDKITCKTTESEGAFTGPKSVNAITRFTGCTDVSAKVSCQNNGFTGSKVGDIETPVNNGEPGTILASKKEGGVLFSGGGPNGELAQFECGGAGTGAGAQIYTFGSLIGVATSDKTATAFTTTFKPSGENQNPESFEGESEKHHETTYTYLSSEPTIEKSLQTLAVKAVAAEAVELKAIA